MPGMCESAGEEESRGEIGPGGARREREGERNKSEGEGNTRIWMGIRWCRLHTKRRECLASSLKLDLDKSMPVYAGRRATSNSGDVSNQKIEACCILRVRAAQRPSSYGA